MKHHVGKLDGWMLPYFALAHRNRCRNTNFLSLAVDGNAKCVMKYDSEAQVRTFFSQYTA